LSQCLEGIGAKILHIKEKAIAVTGRGDPYGCETSRLPHFLDNRLTNGGEVVSRTRRAAALFPPGRFLVLDPGAIVQLEGLSKLKNPMTLSEIEPAIFWVITLCLNKLLYRELQV
jgi:hypothetical protein